MNKDKWSTASLRIVSKSRSVIEISKQLNLTPSRTVEKGSRLSWSNPNSALSEEHRWFLDSGLPDSEPLETHIEKLLFYIEQNATEIKLLLSDCEIDLCCGFASDTSQGGLVLDATLLKRLTATPINLYLDLYPPEDKSSTRQ